MKPEEVALSPWVPVIVQIALGLITVAGTVVGSGVVVHWLNARRAHKEFLRGKLEVLFEAFGQYEQICFLTISLWLLAVTGRLSYEEANARDEKELRGVPNYFGTVQMLIYLYFLPLNPKFRKCVDIFEKGMVDVVRIRDKSSGVSSDMDLVPRLSQCLTDLVETAYKFKSAIRGHGDTLGLLKEEKW
jgi:hypothetical protein